MFPKCWQEEISAVCMMLDSSTTRTKRVVCVVNVAVQVYEQG